MKVEYSKDFEKSAWILLRFSESRKKVVGKFGGLGYLFNALL